MNPHILSVAPMMGRTDRHCRFFLRLVAPGARLYTEMVTAAAVLAGDREHLLGFDPAEHPVALQLGGGDTVALAAAAEIGAALGYDEINLNVGCPSDRVSAAHFGAALMAEPGRVAACVAAMKRAVDRPVTVKCRIGIDDRDAYDDLRGFVAAIVDAGCDAVMVHARKAWLKGVSPKLNRTVPPLRHDRVHRLKRDFPAVAVILNGGLGAVAEIEAHLAHVDGVMIGRAATHDPALLAVADARLGGRDLAPDWRHRVVADYLVYAHAAVARGVPAHALARPLLGLFHGRPGARAWRRYLSENAHRAGAGAGVIADALALVPPADAASLEPARGAA